MNLTPTISAPVRIGIVGAGAFGRLHAQTIAGLSDAVVVALVALGRKMPVARA